MLKNHKLEVVPFEIIRGMTFNDSFVVLDEAQNVTRAEIKAFVTRLGTNSTTVVNGDLQQSDIKEASGLQYLYGIITDDNNKELADKCGLVEFDSRDIVRSGLCRLFVQAFEKDQ